MVCDPIVYKLIFIKMYSLLLFFKIGESEIKMKQPLETVARSTKSVASQRDVKSTCAF